MEAGDIVLGIATLINLPAVIVYGAAAAIFVFVILPLMLVWRAIFGDDTDYADEGA